MGASVASMRIEPSPGSNEFRVIGEIDMSNARHLREFLAQRGASTDRVVLDLSGVTFIDSSAIHALLIGSRTFDGRGSVQLVNLSDPVRRVLEIALPTGAPRLRIEGLSKLAG